MKTHDFILLSAREAAELIDNNDTVAFSGFTPAGTPKVIPRALAERAAREHSAGRPFKINVITGSSTGASLDGALARADAIGFRAPYQSDPDLRQSINDGQTRYFDMDLSRLPREVRCGRLGPVHCAVIEASEVTRYGEITLTSSVGAAPTFARVAGKLLIELNRRHPDFLHGLHDVYEPCDPPMRRDIPIFDPVDRIGHPAISVDPSRILGVVETDLSDEVVALPRGDAVMARIGENIAEFLAAGIRRGRIPRALLPVHCGVGEVAAPILSALGRHPELPPFQMWTEVIQDAVIELMRERRVTFASASSLTVTPENLARIYHDWRFFRTRLLLRPQEITNDCEVVRRLGVISINSAIEMDLEGNVNSSHILGRGIFNGIGGVVDFARHAYLSIFACPSTTKEGRISKIVPHVGQIDSGAHSGGCVLVTEHGVADLRGKSPTERAEAVISRCAHPDYRDQLREYLRFMDHTPPLRSLAGGFGMHVKFAQDGDMRGVDWARFAMA
jgi:acetyl-CoA hydrolase